MKALTRSVPVAGEGDRPEFSEDGSVINAKLVETARTLLAAPKGILAIDESVATITARFDALGIRSTPDTRRDYRELLITTPDLARCISGAILYDETIRQSSADGTAFPQLLSRCGLLTGIKVDTGAKPLAGWPDEKVTEGLDGLRERLAQYRDMGATFAKWRAVISIGAGRPSQACLGSNAHALARYAVLCQEAGLVPIVEPEVLMDGDHTIEQCGQVTSAIQRIVFAELATQGALLEGMILKPNMVVAGSACTHQAAVDEVAHATLACLRRSVPAAVTGVAFLSGGQGADLATEHLGAIAATGPHPWQLTFSYGRALQDDALAAWRGNPANVRSAQTALWQRACANSMARAES